MGRQRNNLQSKEKEESPERVLNVIAGCKISDIELKTMIIRKLNELSENYQNLHRSYKELTVNSISMKQDIETINKSNYIITNYEIPTQ